MEQTTEQSGWYALKVFFNKVFDIEDLLVRAGFETYIPVRTVEVKGEECVTVAYRLPEASKRPVEAEEPAEEQRAEEQERSF